jgi:hypothetical protein
MQTAESDFAVTAIGTDKYYLGTDKNGNEISGFQTDYANHLFSIQSQDEFVMNYVHSDTLENDTIVNDKIIVLFQKYFNHGQSATILEGKSTLTLDSEEDRIALLQHLTKRVIDLTNGRNRYIVDIKEKKKIEHIQRIIAYIEKATIVPGSSSLSGVNQGTQTESEKVVLNDDQILLALLRMAWYLLHPDKVPREIQESWNIMLGDIKNVLNIDDILTAIKEIRIADGANEHGMYAPGPETKSVGGLYAPGPESPEEKTSIPSVSSSTDTSKTQQIVMHAPGPGLTSEQPILSRFGAIAKSKGNEEIDKLKRHIATFLLLLEGHKLVQEGGSHKPLHKMGMKPIVNYIHNIYPSYSFTSDILPVEHIVSVERIIRICRSLSTQKQYGFYRITGIPHIVFTFIQQHIIAKRNESVHTELHGYQYLLCLDGNMSFIKGSDTKKQKKERKAIKTYFRKGNLYVVHTDKNQFDLSDYMRDPYFVYDINYNTINDITNVLRITPTDSLLNEESVDFSRYLRVNQAGIIDCTYLELSLFHQLKHITLE